MPSFAKRSATGTFRSPAALTSRTVAPSACRTGAVSVDETARQRGLDVATQQMSPAFFMQKPIAWRHS
jgi:hypothetical protein